MLVYFRYGKMFKIPDNILRGSEHMQVLNFICLLLKSFHFSSFLFPRQPDVQLRKTFVTIVVIVIVVCFVKKSVVGHFKIILAFYFHIKG